MGMFDSSPSSSSTSNSAHGMNDVPAPRSDASVNAPPADQHKRVMDFVKVSYDSRSHEICIRMKLLGFGADFERKLRTLSTSIDRDQVGPSLSMSKLAQMER